MPTNRPTGTITFLFTDIEGSTALWESHPEQMRLAVTRHDAILRQVVENNEGYLFKTTGDGIAAAFATALEALGAAVSAQVALLAEPWPTSTPLKSRMSLHTGTAELRDGDYFGPALNRAARLMAAGHGRQILLSDVTSDLCRDMLPADITLDCLGEHQLKDLARTETIFQVQHAGFPSEFPPLKTLDNPDLPNNLPRQLTSFIGREKEVSQVTALLAKTGLLTLTGSGGSGKTRLSLQIAADALEEYPDGAWFAELAPLSDPLLVPRTVASVLGIREQAGQVIMQTIAESLKSKRLLLLLDNAEHLISASVTLVATLLRSCPQVKILVTSREPLAIAGEQIYRVPPLSLPNPKQAVGATAQSLSQFEAVRLFIERALLVRPGFTVTNANAPALAQLCFRLDGIPLAIELAAARVRSLPVEQINDRLDSRFRLLTGGDRSALPRQQTLRALIDWSYDLLGDAEKTLLARLAVFAGGWTLAAAERVGAGESVSPGKDPIVDWEVLDLLTSLADKSLILADDAGIGEAAPRYRMLETVRQYAQEKSDADGEIPAALARHRQWCLSLAEDAETKLAGPDQAIWMNRIETEYDNLRAALEGYSADAAKGHSMHDAAAGSAAALAGLRLAGALSRFWWVRGYLSEGREHLERALAAQRAVDRAVDPEAEADASVAKKAAGKALRAAGSLAWQQGDFASARAFFEESLRTYREIGDRDGTANTLGSLGILAWSQSEYAAAKDLYGEALTLFRESGNQGNIANILGNLGALALSESDYVAAQALLEEALSIFQELGNKSGAANTMMSLGIVASELEDHPAARSLYEECLVLYREIGEKRGIANSLMNLADEDWRAADFASAWSHHVGCLEIYREVGDKRGIAFTLENMASASSAASDARRALLLRAAAAQLRISIGAPLAPDDQKLMNGKIAQSRLALGDDAFAHAWAEGSAMSLDQALDHALAGGSAGPGA